MSFALAAALLVGNSVGTAQASSFPSDNPSGDAGTVGTSSNPTTVVATDWYESNVYTVDYGEKKSFYFLYAGAETNLFNVEVRCVDDNRNEVGTYGGGGVSGKENHTIWTFTETCYFVNQTSYGSGHPAQAG